MRRVAARDRIMQTARHVAIGLLALLAACTQEPLRPAPRPDDVRAQIVRLLPPATADKGGWAADIYAAFATLQLEPTPDNLCATVAVTAQESSFDANPSVPNLGRIARAEIDRRATRHHIPQLLVRGALALTSPNGKSYGERLAGARTERELSLIFEDLIGEVPLGRQLFADANPVRTGGPMQVSVAFAEQHVHERPYPFATTESVRHEVFTRRGGLYFGIAHLLAYPAGYDAMRYRFADYNAGHYASRNAAFQRALSVVSGVPLALDGDLILHDSDDVSATERAARVLATRLDLTHSQIHRMLERGEELDFERSSLYRRVLDLAEAAERRSQPYAVLPQITLKSPKITRKLTTAWFATRVEERYQACMTRAMAPRAVAATRP
jgi:hypothetical protein